jgi:hypothetical protein
LYKNFFALVIPSKSKWIQVPTLPISIVPNGSTPSFMTCWSTFQYPMEIHPKFHVPNKCAQDDQVNLARVCPMDVSSMDLCLMNVHWVDVCPTSASHDCVPWMFVPKGTSTIRHIPQFWNAQLLRFVCSRSTQVYKIHSNSLCHFIRHASYLWIR